MKNRKIFFLLAAISVWGCADRVTQTDVDGQQEIAASFRALVDISVANLREEPRDEGEMGTQALMGSVVEVVGKKGDWLHVVAPDGYKAWISEGSLVSDDEAVNSWKMAKKLIVTVHHTVAYTHPSGDSEVVTPLVMGDVIASIGESFGRYAKAALPSGKEVFVAAADVALMSQYFENITIDGNIIADFCRQFVGAPYLWGGSSPSGFDCSGLTQFAYMMHGRLLPRNASAQVKEGTEVLIDNGFESLAAGDLLFFGRSPSNSSPERVTHVGLYLGGGMFIHASSMYGRVTCSSLDASSDIYYPATQNLLHARRII